MHVTIDPAILYFGTPVGECVLNLPSLEQVAAVDRLARTTGSDAVPPHKVAMGYRHERDRPHRSHAVAPARHELLSVLRLGRDGAPVDARGDPGVDVPPSPRDR